MHSVSLMTVGCMLTLLASSNLSSADSICKQFGPKSGPIATGLCSAISYVFGNRCESDCRSRGREFDPAWSHTFVELDHELISTVILLPSAESLKKGCCQLQAKVCAHSTG